VRLTQQQLLEEAARTEVENKRSLELLLMLQEERKRERVRVATLQAPRIVWRSSSRGVRRDAQGNALDPVRQSLSFTMTSRVPQVINATAPPLPQRAICTITGLPAKYRDPRTGVPFRTPEAFQVIRGSHSKKARRADPVVLL
jgi:vacuolar protein sorting-associated protein 72